MNGYFRIRTLLETPWFKILQSTNRIAWFWGFFGLGPKYKATLNVVFIGWRLAHPGGPLATNKAAALAKFLKRKLNEPGGAASLDPALVERAVDNAKATALAGIDVYFNRQLSSYPTVHITWAARSQSLSVFKLHLLFFPWPSLSLLAYGKMLTVCDYAV